MAHSAIHLKIIVIVGSLAFALLMAVFGVHFAHAQEEISLETTSDQGTFVVAMTWEPNEIGRDNTFAISFIEPETGSILEDIQYNVRVLNEETGEQTFRRVDQVSEEQMLSFDTAGPYTIVIEDIEGLGEDASFTLQVTPEFPVGAIIPIVAGTAIVVLVVRHNRENLFSQG